MSDKYAQRRYPHINKADRTGSAYFIWKYIHKGFLDRPVFHGRLKTFGSCGDWGIMCLEMLHDRQIRSTDPVIRDKAWRALDHKSYWHHKLRNKNLEKKAEQLKGHGDVELIPFGRLKKLVLSKDRQLYFDAGCSKLLAGMVKHCFKKHIGVEEALSNISKDLQKVSDDDLNEIMDPTSCADCKDSRFVFQEVWAALYMQIASDDGSCDATKDLDEIDHDPFEVVDGSDPDEIPLKRNYFSDRLKVVRDKADLERQIRQMVAEKRLNIMSKSESSNAEAHGTQDPETFNSVESTEGAKGTETKEAADRTTENRAKVIAKTKELEAGVARGDFKVWAPTVEEMERIEASAPVNIKQEFPEEETTPTGVTQEVRMKEEDPEEADIRGQMRTISKAPETAAAETEAEERAQNTAEGKEFDAAAAATASGEFQNFMTEKVKAIEAAAQRKVQQESAEREVPAETPMDCDTTSRKRARAQHGLATSAAEASKSKSKNHKKR